MILQAEQAKNAYARDKLHHRFPTCVASVPVLSHAKFLQVYEFQKIRLPYLVVVNTVLAICVPMHPSSVDAHLLQRSSQWSHDSRDGTVWEVDSEQCDESLDRARFGLHTTMWISFPVFFRGSRARTMLGNVDERARKRDNSTNDLSRNNFLA